MIPWSRWSRPDVGGNNGHDLVNVRCGREGTSNLDDLLQASASLHHHLCPRQVLGVRMGLLAGHWLGLELPQRDKRLLAIMETDGCAADGVAVATGCWVGRRTLRVLDFGKVAASFVDTHSEPAVRIAPQPTCREAAVRYAPQAPSRWEAYLIGYRHMPDGELLQAQDVSLTVPLRRLLSREGHRVQCYMCGEDIFNEREVWQAGRPLCRSCSGERYYSSAGTPGVMLRANALD